jgi:hypothetical protein
MPALRRHFLWRGGREEGRRKKEEGRRKKEEGRRKKEEGRRKKEEGRRGTLAEASINTRDFLTKIKDPSIIAP